MINKGYIKAFTVLEAVVSMAISAILLSIVFVVFSVTSQRLMDFKIQNDKINDLNRLNYSITKSVFECEKMLVNDNIVEFKDHKGDLTKYILGENEQYRIKGAFTDTFKIAILDFRIDTISGKTKTKIFHRLQFQIDNEGENIELNFYRKIYPGELLISNE